MNDSTSRDVREVLEFAVAAEDAGWDGVFVSDSMSDGATDPWTTLGASAARTEQAELATWVTARATQPPGRLAQAVASLDQRSQGRIMSPSAPLAVLGEARSATPSTTL